MKKSGLIIATILFGIGHCMAQSKVAGADSNKRRVVQITFISPMGSNGTEAPTITNRISINILAGVSGGLDGIEAGGLLNAEKGSVKGMQAAGMANIVSKNAEGIQLAGFINYTGAGLKGAALAGFCNVNKGESYGVQCSGFTNTNFGGFDGAQLSGFANYNHKSMKGIQGAGYINVNNGDLTGAQLSGFLNINKGTIKGAQVAGFLNVAKKVKGLQLGFMNIADTVDGMALGFCNIVKHGLHQVEISADEMFYTNLSVRSGTHRFYNIFTTGATPGNKNLLWYIGYGAGTSIRLTDKLRNDVTLSVQHVSSGLLYHATSELYKAYWGVEYKLAKSCYVAAGPTFNLYWGDALMPDYATTYANISPYHVLNETNTYGFNFKAWVGAKLAFRFL